MGVYGKGAKRPFMQLMAIFPSCCRDAAIVQHLPLVRGAARPVKDIHKRNLAQEKACECLARTFSKPLFHGYAQEDEPA
jgi:hypothetical protein